MVDMNIYWTRNVCFMSIQIYTHAKWIVVTCFTFFTNASIGFHFLIIIIIIDIHINRKSLCFAAIWWGILAISRTCSHPSLLITHTLPYSPIAQPTQNYHREKIVAGYLCTPNKINGAWHKPHSCVHTKYHSNCLSTNKLRSESEWASQRVCVCV